MHKKWPGYSTEKLLETLDAWMMLPSTVEGDKMIKDLKQEIRKRGFKLEAH